MAATIRGWQWAMAQVRVASAFTEPHVLVSLPHPLDPSASDTTGFPKSIIFGGSLCMHGNLFGQVQRNNL